ncbi:hypothetical protein Vadar_007061 [Vaccinium darrowii]|uniref:Uncharacterized protein n=1 Tax=Vaccinium darrowii TaxID=229202 RepID=A0ACB7Z1X3_9ERIC|nr:hypothetical protein Vadar_007061 [Vaccinium darrowii]
MDQIPYNCISMIQISKILTSSGCKVFAETLLGSDAEKTYDDNIDGGLTVFCPDNDSFKNFFPNVDPADGGGSFNGKNNMEIRDDDMDRSNRDMDGVMTECKEPMHDMAKQRSLVVDKDNLNTLALITCTKEPYLENVPFKARVTDQSTPAETINALEENFQ